MNNIDSIKKHPHRDGQGFHVDCKNGHLWSVVDLNDILRKAGISLEMIASVHPWGGIEGMRMIPYDGEMVRGASFEEVIKSINKIEGIPDSEVK
jgi:hypothetical protein